LADLARLLEPYEVAGRLLALALVLEPPVLPLLEPLVVPIGELASRELVSLELVSRELVSQQLVSQELVPPTI
jgi:hypothetical protein